MDAGFAIPIVGALVLVPLFVIIVAGIIVLTTVSTETRNKILFNGAIAISLGAVGLFSVLTVGVTTKSDTYSPRSRTVTRDATYAAVSENGVEAPRVDPSRYVANPSEEHEDRSVRPAVSSSRSFWDRVPPSLSPLSVLLIVGGVMAIFGSLAPYFTTRLYSENRPEWSRAKRLQTMLATGGAVAAAVGLAIARGGTGHTSTMDRFLTGPNAAFVWATVAVGAGAIAFVQFALRRRDGISPMSGPWRPAGAIASAAVLAAFGSVFVLKTPNPAHRIALNESPSFKEFLLRRFGTSGAVTSGQRDLLELASETNVSEDESRTPDFELIGLLPYGKPLEENSTYSKGFVFSSGRAGAPAAEGVWEPLLCSDEIYRVSDLTAGGDPTFDYGRLPVSHNETEAIPDDALILIGEPSQVTLSAVASGQFTTVTESWNDLLSKLRDRIALENQQTDPKYYQQMATQGLHNAVTRMAVSRRPLILENELDDDLVQPMYRVHIAINDSIWDNTTDPRSFAMGAGRERSMIIVFVLAGLTLLFGGFASIAASPSKSISQ